MVLTHLFKLGYFSTPVHSRLFHIYRPPQLLTISASTGGTASRGEVPSSYAIQVGVHPLCYCVCWLESYCKRQERVHPEFWTRRQKHVLGWRSNNHSYNFGVIKINHALCDYPCRQTDDSQAGLDMLPAGHGSPVSRQELSTPPRGTIPAFLFGMLFTNTCCTCCALPPHIDHHAGRMPLHHVV